MPRDEMNSLIQKIARQARLTFRSSTGGGLGPSTENLNQLRKLVGQIRAEDLRIRPRQSAGGGGQGPISVPHNPPVTYMHICETNCFSMGVFLLKGGASIPLHDHPEMHGLLKVLYGKVRISGFDKLDSSGGGKGETTPLHFSPPLLPYQRGAVRRAALRSSGEFSETSPPCLLSPHRDNLHQISAVDGPAAFLDILAPPYDPGDGRDCHYYKLLQPAAGPSSNSGETDGPPAAAATTAGGGVTPREVWLLEIPQPDDFWCGGEAYPGPKVSL
ncbi:2-aminoethanethiol dioxygenase [Rhinophrynus dorsalis]